MLYQPCKKFLGANMASENRSARVKRCWGRTKGLGRCEKRLGTIAWYPFCHQHRRQPLRWLGMFGSAIAVALGLILGSYSIYQGIQSSREVAQLRKDLRALKSNSLLTGRLEKQCPLRYWLLAPHEDRAVASPSLDVMPMEIDWNVVRVNRHIDGSIEFLLPDVTQSQGGRLSFSFGHNRVVLGSGVFRGAIELNQMRIVVQRIDATRTGNFFVVGIEDTSESDPHG